MTVREAGTNLGACHASAGALFLKGSCSKRCAVAMWCAAGPSTTMKTTCAPRLATKTSRRIGTTTKGSGACGTRGRRDHSPARGSPLHFGERVQPLIRTAHLTMSSRSRRISTGSQPCGSESEAWLGPTRLFCSISNSVVSKHGRSSDLPIDSRFTNAA